MKYARFVAGADVPAYIVDIEPLTPMGPRPPVIFSNETDVFELDDRFVLVPLNVDEGDDIGVITIDTEGSAVSVDQARLRLFPATKTVVMVRSWSSIIFDSDDGDGDEDSPTPDIPNVFAA